MIVPSARPEGRTTVADRGGSGFIRIERLQDGPALFVRLFNEGDAEGFAALFEPEGVLVAEPGEQAAGTAAIREAVAVLVGGTRALTLTRGGVQQSGDLVLVTYAWAIAGTGPGGDILDRQGHGVVVFRRQPDGAWLAVFDNLCVGQ